MMKQVQVNVEVSTEALERARKAFAKVTLTPEQVKQIEQASEAVSHITVLAGIKRFVKHATDPYAATRLAIVREAAEIGKTKNAN